MRPAFRKFEYHYDGTPREPDEYWAEVEREAPGTVAALPEDQLDAIWRSILAKHCLGSNCNVRRLFPIMIDKTKPLWNKEFFSFVVRAEGEQRWRDPSSYGTNVWWGLIDQCVVCEDCEERDDRETECSAIIPDILSALERRGAPVGILASEIGRRSRSDFVYTRDSGRLSVDARTLGAIFDRASVEAVRAETEDLRSRWNKKRLGSSPARAAPWAELVALGDATLRWRGVRAEWVAVVVRSARR